MIRKAGTLAITLLLLAAFGTPTEGQTPRSTILEIDVDNLVEYQQDTSDLSKFATDPNVTTVIPTRNFFFRVGIGDIVAVNGQPVKGTLTRNIRQILLRTTADPGQAIADAVRNGVLADSFEILTTDGTSVGTIVTYGTAAGSPPAGGPLSVTQGNFAIVGGTGAFLGVRGQYGNAVTSQSTPIRQASITEDPANRRLNKGGWVHFSLQIISMFTPAIAVTALGPAIVHSNDFSLVTTAKPAAAGEILALFATGLGPTRPGVDPGKPFPASPLAAVSTPIEVLVNGKRADVTAAVGFPGSVDGYQVNFRVPSDATTGTATLQVSAAWIAAGVASITVQ